MKSEAPLHILYLIDNLTHGGTERQKRGGHERDRDAEDRARAEELRDALVLKRSETY